ncbi:MAG: acyl-CoA dehydrogenase family protein [Desulfurococcales archaeon]|nr:acyl-CoA dehydrogenase family protein [Desulfurococcales archaeon]
MPLEGLEHLSMAYGLNHYSLDRDLRETLKYFLGYEPDLNALGKYTGTTLYEVAYRVDRMSPPELIMWDVRGERAEVTWLDPMERMVIRDLMLEYGVNKPPFTGGSWHEHYAAINLIGDPGVACIFTITIQTAYALRKYGPDEVRGYYENLVGLKEPLMLGATWFTEVQGGSDLGANTTKAEPRGRKWVLNGYKYFSSGAGIADIALATARPPGARPGAKGLALFVVPRLREDGSLNYYVRRLKLKSGTVAVPTGEVEFIDSEAYLVGEAEKGIYYTLEDLMVSRLSNAAGSVGISRKAYLEAYHYALHRRAFGRKIIDHQLVRRDLLEMELLTLESAVITHKAVDLFEKSSSDTPPYTPLYHYARLMTHIAKNITAYNAARVTMLAMELFGGIGFLSEYMIERWHREALITPIWEGTSNIQALDMLEAIAKKRAHEPLLQDMEALTRDALDKKLANTAFNHLTETLKDLASMSPQEAEYNAKYALEDLGHSATIIVLESMAAKLGEERLHHAASLLLESVMRRRPVPRPQEKVLEDIISLGGELPL